MKSTIVARLAEQLHVPVEQAQRMLDQAIAILSEMLVEEGRVELRDLGTFEVKVLKERRGRNPRTGEKLIIPAKKYVKFKATRKLEDRLV